MEIALKPEIPTYSGGLGVLAGDILKSGADMGVPMVGITLLYKKGYFAQKIDKNGRQTEYPVDWNPRDFMTQLSEPRHRDDEPQARHRRRVDLHARRPVGAQASNSLPRHRPPREHARGPSVHGGALRRRQPLPSLPGADTRHRRPAHTARPRFPQHQDLPPQRGGTPASSRSSCCASRATATSRRSRARSSSRRTRPSPLGTTSSPTTSSTRCSRATSARYCASTSAAAAFR